MTEFEAYLLNKMRNNELVSIVLRKEGTDKGKLKSMAQWAAEKWKLDIPGYNANVFNEAIGQPIWERPLVSTETPPVFTGSVQRAYRLRIWPYVLFRCNQHPVGYAWSEGFLQERDNIQWRGSSVVKPWEWVANTLQEKAYKSEVLDHWDHEKELRLSFLESGQTVSYRAAFDFDLLQHWTRDD